MPAKRNCIFVLSVNFCFYKLCSINIIAFSAFDFAFDLAKTGMKSKMPDIHLKYAMYLEDEG